MYIKAYTDKLSVIIDSNQKFFFLFFYRQTKTITINCTEYARLLQNDVKNIKLTELINAKSQQIKTLQTQLAYYRKKAMKRPASGEENEEQAEPELPVKCKFDIL